MAAEAMEIRPCTRLEEIERCVELQREVWGFADVELVPRDIMVAMAMAGGHIFGAFDGDRMVAFVLAFPGYRGGRPHLHSHMLAVLPGYRDRGLGRQLKLRQREDALAREIELIEWTFDPLELKNAYFNLERLGAIVRQYVPNKYGRTTSPLHAGLPTDRLVAEWWLRSGRVENVVAGRRPPHSEAGVRVRVPINIAELKRSDPALAERLQSRTREEFQQWLAQGYAATGFEFETDAGAYLLEPFEEPA
ncbi:MAG: GNAT family N-acetyltransferase [Acidobacteria bacterium]|nr:GNAT family N-acetyltransferase [Acidobacteriota bacterium]